MIRSMTGFGDASALAGGVQYKVELRSVNNKFLKATFRMSDRLQVLEPWIDSILRTRLHRGSVTVSISHAEADETAVPKINPVVLRHYANDIASALGVHARDVDAAVLVNLPGVLSQPEQGESFVDRAREALEPLLHEAIDHLVSMRSREGHGLREDLLGRHAEIVERLGRIAELAPGVSEAYEKRLSERLTKLLDQFGVDAELPDILREVAIFAEKTDIAEEIARLGEHLVHFKELVDSEDPRPVGRTLDFLTQELLREANTISSKSPDSEISRLIVEVKGAIDRIKEQVQNAE
ncbi:MAG: YicC/YloC family endoribonuclease [Phycisphaerales bacterium JB040]